MYILILCIQVLGIMIKNYETVREIKINEKEYKLSQYADDTLMFKIGRNFHEVMI